MSPETHSQQLNIMESPLKQKERAMDINAILLSPPEPRRSEYAFSSPVSVSMSRTPSQSTIMASSQPSQGSSAYLAVEKNDQRLPLSPPISPATRKEDVVTADEGTRDPPLFPVREESDTVSRQPLFPQDEHQAAIDTHIATHGRVCAEEDYKLMLDVCSNTKFTSNVGELYNRNPQKWAAHSLWTMDFYTNIAKKAKADAARAAKSATNKPSTHRRLAPASEGGVRKKVTTPRVQRVPKPKRSPPQHTFDSFAFPARDNSPKQPKLATSRDDVDFDSIPNYCPPTETLGNNAKALKADWKGNMLDLSMDPDRHRLHEAEVHLAATLRLSCAVYLSSKRRIFVARVECMKRGKEFRKTDAQQACKIDVNKASKLWTAFEKVGWFDERYFVGKV